MLAPILAGLAGLAAMCSNPPKRRKRKAPRRLANGMFASSRPRRERKQRTVSARIRIAEGFLRQETDPRVRANILGMLRNLRAEKQHRSNPRRKGRRIRVDEAASRLAWWRHHRNPTSRDLSKVIAALNNPRRRRSRK